MNKKDRKIVFDKFGGRCAYCGCELTGKWCADHVEPIFRKRKMVGGYMNVATGKYAGNDVVIDETFHSTHTFNRYRSVPDGCNNPDKDVIENMMPSCFSCNHYKSTFGIDSFREQIGLLVGRLNKSFTQYKIAKRFGLVTENIKPVVFYFETYSPTPNK